MAVSLPALIVFQITNRSKEEPLHVMVKQSESTEHPSFDVAANETYKFKAFIDTVLSMTYSPVLPGPVFEFKMTSPAGLTTIMNGTTPYAYVTYDNRIPSLTIAPPAPGPAELTTIMNGTTPSPAPGSADMYFSAKITNLTENALHVLVNRSEGKTEPQFDVPAYDTKPFVAFKDTVLFITYAGRIFQFKMDSPSGSTNIMDDTTNYAQVTFDNQIRSLKISSCPEGFCPFSPLPPAISYSRSL